MPNIFDELVAEMGPQRAPPFTEEIAGPPGYSPDDVLANIARARNELPIIETPSRETVQGPPQANIFEQILSEEEAAPTMEPQVVEAPEDERDFLQHAYGPGSFQHRAMEALRRGHPIDAEQIVGEATERA